MNRLHFIKTIWEDCILFESNGEYALIDTGMIEHYDTIISCLKSLNIPKFKFILITHFHRDHYGNLTNILKEFKVDTIYIKKYSKLDGTTSLEEDALDDYRKIEWNKYVDIINTAKKYSQVIEIDDTLKCLYLNDFKLNLYNTKDNLKEIYNDKNSVNYHKYRYNENYNCVLILAEIYGNTIYLTSDIPDEEVEDNKLCYLNRKFIKEFNKKIDIYKIPHHGVSEYNPSETLTLVNPKYSIITNWEHELQERFSILNDLKEFCPTSEVYLTEHHTIIFNFDDITRKFILYY